MSGPITIQELLIPPDRTTVFNKYMSMLRTMGVPVDSWLVGGVLRAILTIVANFYADQAALMAQAIAGFFLEQASGSWLVMLAKYVYGVQAITATFATGQLTLTNSSGGMFTFAAFAAQFKNPTTGNTYRNTAGFTLNPNATLTVAIQADQSGSASTSAAGTITALVTTMTGVTCANASDVIGSDAESDPALRTRCLNSIAATSPNGPRGAYQFAALSALNAGVPVNINRAAVTPYSSTGQVKVWLASPSGVPTPSDINAAIANIQAIAEPDTDTVTVMSANPVMFTRTLTVWASSLKISATDDIPTLVQNQLAAFISVYPLGGIAKPPATQAYLYAESIQGVAQSAHPAIFDVDIDNDTDMAMNPGDVAALSVTVNLRTVVLN